MVTGAGPVWQPNGRRSVREDEPPEERGTPPVARAGQGGEWRWRWDLNPRWACTHTRFRGVLLRPLGHATAGECTRRRLRPPNRNRVQSAGSSGGRGRSRRAAGRGPERRPGRGSAGRTGRRRRRRPPSGGSKLAAKPWAASTAAGSASYACPVATARSQRVDGHLVDRDQGGDLRRASRSGPPASCPRTPPGRATPRPARPAGRRSGPASPPRAWSRPRRGCRPRGCPPCAPTAVNASASPPMWSSRSADRVVRAGRRVAQLVVADAAHEVGEDVRGRAEVEGRHARTDRALAGVLIGGRPAALSTAATAAAAPSRDRARARRGCATPSSRMVRSIWPLEDLDGPVDAVAAAGHQAVEVGPADQREVGAVGDRGDDVLAGHDPGVEVHLEVAADLA